MEERLATLPMPQQNPNMGETPPPQDEEVSSNFLIGSETVLMCDFQKDQENIPPPPPRPAKSNPTVTQSSGFRKPTASSSAPSFSQPNSGHFSGK
jgi:hypothetical protein